MTRSRMTSAAVAVALAATLGGFAPTASAADAPGGPDVAAVGAGAASGASRAGGAAGSGTSGGTSYSDGLLRRTTTIADARESASPSAAQRVTRIVATQDVVAKRLTASVSFAAAPTAAASALVYVALGDWSGSSCTPQAMLAVESRPGGSTAGAHISAAGAATGEFKVARGGSGATVTLTSAPAGVFRTAELDCAYALVQSADGATRYQSFYAEGLTEVYKPSFEVTGGAPVQGARAGRWTTLRLDVRNDGRGVARNVKIRAQGSSMTIKKASRSLGTLDGRTTKYGVVYKVRLKGAKSRKITFTVTADGGYTATKSFTIAREPAPQKYKSLAGRYFWGFQPTTVSSSSGWDTMTMRFLDARWVYIGDMKGRTPTCRKVTKTCKRYTYDARTGRAKIGAQKFKVTTKGFAYRLAKGEQRSSFSPATLPSKGTRLKADLVHQDWSGFCMISCTAWTESLSLRKDGRFVRGRVSVGSWTGLGTSWASVPADQRGTYKVVKKGVIELRYANGTKKRMTIAIDHDIRGKASAAGAGVILGLTNYYHQD